MLRSEHGFNEGQANLMDTDEQDSVGEEGAFLEWVLIPGQILSFGY